MSKELYEMTLEELWQLFPIVLTEHQDEWSDWYTQEASRLKEILPSCDYHISHIGSTAIPSIWAKPIVDILVEIPEDMSMDAVKEALLAADYLCMCEETNRKDFNLGYTKDGFAERVFHLHLRYLGDHDEIYFRDYMIENRTIAKEYEKLKLSLWKKYEHDRDAYTEAKGDFVRKCTEKAKTMQYENGSF